MRLKQVSSFGLQIFFCVCFLSAFGEGLVANKVTYEYGAKIPKDVSAAATVIRPVKRQSLATEFKAIPIVKGVSPSRIVRQDIATPPKQIRQRTGSVILPKPELPPLRQQVKQSFVETNPLPTNYPQPPLVKDLQPPVVIRKQPLPIIQKPLEVKPRKLKIKKHPQYVSPTIAESKQENKKYIKKLLQKPMAFSYNKDLKTAASHDNSAADINYSVHEDIGDDNYGDDSGDEEGVHAEINDSSDQGEIIHGGNDHGGKHHFVKGGGAKRHKGHFHKEGDKGEKDYKGHHDYEKEEKGHHDKEGHKGRYLDESGHKKSHHYDDGMFAEHQNGEKGQKASDYAEKGKYSKGHSTKGEHNIHKLDEYEKKKEFFDESHDSGEDENNGAFYEEKEYKKGGSTKIGHHDSGHHKDGYAKEGHHEKGGHYKEHKDHDDSAERDQYHKNHAEHAKKGGHHADKKWGQKKETDDGDLGGHDANDGYGGQDHWSHGGDDLHIGWNDRIDHGDDFNAGEHDGGDDEGDHDGDETHGGDNHGNEGVSQHQTDVGQAADHWSQRVVDVKAQNVNYPVIANKPAVIHQIKPVHHIPQVVAPAPIPLLLQSHAGQTIGDDGRYQRLHTKVNNAGHHAGGSHAGVKRAVDNADSKGSHSHTFYVIAH